MSVRGLLHLGDAPKLPLLLLAGGIVQRELDDLRHALNAGVARIGLQDPQHGGGGDLRLLPAFRHYATPSQNAKLPVRAEY